MEYIGGVTMAKQRKKEKKHKAPMPPLSTLDRFIYITLMVISFIACFILGVLLDVIKHLIAFSDKTVIAYEGTIADLLFLPFLIFILLFGFISLSSCMYSKTPIFGKKGITYGPPMYKAKYPLFMRNKPEVYVKPSEKRWRKTKCILILGILVLTLIPLGFSFCGRKCLTDDVTIQQYNIVNVKKSEYNIDEIESTTLKAYYHIGGKYSRSYWEVSIEFATNNKNFEFDYSNFKPFGDGAHTETLDMLLDIKSKLNSKDIEYDGADNLEYVIEEKGLNEKESEMLYELFNAN